MGWESFLVRFYIRTEEVVLSVKVSRLYSSQKVSQGGIPRYPYVQENILDILERDWNVRSDCTMCIWNTHDNTGIFLYCPYMSHINHTVLLFVNYRYLLFGNFIFNRI